MKNTSLSRNKKKSPPSNRRVAKETDLYPAVKALLQSQGYIVKGEVLDCDVTALRDNTTLSVVELKLALNLKLILQAVERMDMVDYVYIAIPHDDIFYRKNRRTVTKLLRRLGLGLINVESERNRAQAVLDPSEYRPRRFRKKRERLLKEFSGLNGDPNMGGSSTRKKRMTLYRQQALEIAVYMREKGSSKASNVRDAVKNQKARNILYDNHYGWFEAHGKGIYGLTERGKKELEEWTPLMR